MHKDVTMPVKMKQKYCKPVYKKYQEVCNNNQLCTGVRFVAGATTVPTDSSVIPIRRLVYETSYKDVVMTKNSKQLAYVCCPGWIQISPKSNGCNKGKTTV